MTRRGKYVTVAVSLAAVVLIASLLTGLFYIKKNHSKTLTELESGYQSNFYAMREGINTVESNIAKIMVSASDAESGILAAQNHRAASEALDSLGRLPIKRENTVKTVKFLNQLEDWSYSLTAAALRGKDLTEYRAQAENLLAAATQLKERIDNILAKVKEDFLIINHVGDSELLSFDFKEKDSEPDDEYPSLIYDGPYSDAEQKKSFGALESLKEIGADEAKKAAIDYGFLDPTIIGEGDEPQSFIFSCNYDGKDAFVEISKKGGLILLANVLTDKDMSDIDENFAIKKASEYARKLGYASFVPVWYNQVDGEAVVNFAGMESGVICYTNLIKVKVNSAGEFGGVEATGYSRTHEESELKPVLTASEAVSRTSPILTVKNVRLALIPDGRTERLCYEVTASYKGATYFVYIDANDGEEAEIMQTVDLPGQGRMVI